MVVKWTDGIGKAGSESGGTRGRLAVGGQQVGPVATLAEAASGKGNGERQAKLGERWGNASCHGFHLGLGRTRGARSRKRGRFGPMHFGPKSKAGMGARG
jgi:hypothetical protein